MRIPFELWRHSATVKGVLRMGVNLFWMAFLADGVLFLLDEWSATVSWLSVVRSVLAFVVLLASLVLAAAVVFNPRVPKRVVVPLILFAWWSGPALAFPLELAGLPQVQIWVAGAQILLAGAVWKLWGRRERLPFAVPTQRVRFSWIRAAALGLMLFAAAALCAAISLCSGLVQELEMLSGGYIRVRPDGIYIMERRFESGDAEVRLTGMMHVAEHDFYAKILPAPDPALPSVVLVEGVTDRKGLLTQDGLQFGRLARLLNVASQEESTFAEDVANGMEREIQESRRPQLRPPSPSQPVGTPPAESDAPDTLPGSIDFRHADVDVETFHPSTIAFLVTVVGLLQAEDPTQLLEVLTDPSSPLRDAEAQSLAMQDILHTRNETLLAEIQLSLKTYRRIIVPWGAMHLPEVESWLRARNFVQSEEVERKALAFW